MPARPSAAVALLARARRLCHNLIIGAALAILSSGGAMADESSFETIDATALQALIERGVPVVDIRTAPEWRQTGVIAGASRITAFDQSGQFVTSFPEAFSAVAGPEDEVALICWTGARSDAIAAAITSKIGYTKVYNVDGGMSAWIGEGRDVEACNDC